MLSKSKTPSAELICHYILWRNFSEVLRSFAHINRLYCFLQQAFKHMYLDLGSGELKFQGLCFHVQCLESPHQNFQQLCQNYCIISKNKVIDLGIGSECSTVTGHSVKRGVKK